MYTCILLFIRMAYNNGDPEQVPAEIIIYNEIDI